jgi:hypothetical protein
MTNIGADKFRLTVLRCEGVDNDFVLRWNASASLEHQKAGW